MENDSVALGGIDKWSDNLASKRNGNAEEELSQIRISKPIESRRSEVTENGHDEYLQNMTNVNSI